MDDKVVDPFRQARFILELRRAGVTDETVLSAMETVNRANFVRKSAQDQAYSDCVLPIPCGQIVPRPVTVAGLVLALELGTAAEGTVLVVGSGSGYTAAVIGHLARQVYGVERYAGLVSFSRDNLERNVVRNVEIRHGDGLDGWPDKAPFDRIVLLGSVERVPDTLFDQLADDGFLLAPLEGDDGQLVYRLRDEDRKGQVISVSRFLALSPGVAAVL